MTDALADTTADDESSSSGSDRYGSAAAPDGGGSPGSAAVETESLPVGEPEPVSREHQGEGSATGVADRADDATGMAHPPGSDEAPDERLPLLVRLRRWPTGVLHRLVEAPAESWVTFVVVGACALFVILQLNVANVLANNTPAGGDMGAHVWGPAFMRDELLTKGRLTGWTSDWYAGFPAYQFYMVLPSLLIALLSLVIPYGVAFKLVAVSGAVTLPIAAWACGKLSDLPFPAPPLFAVAGTVYLFDRSFSIYGGNIASTLAGEFAFSISLSLALVFVGTFARALRTGKGKHRGWAAILLAACGLCHLIPFIFAMVASVLFVMLMPGLTAKARERVGGLIGLGLAGGLFYLANPAKGYSAPYGFLEPFVDPSEGLQSFFKVLSAGVATASLAVLVRTIVTAGRHLIYTWVPVLAVGGMLSAWWTVPFYLNHKYMNDMGWERKDDVLNMLFVRSKLDPQLLDAPPIKWLLILAGAGALLAIIWWRRGGVFWVMAAATFAALFVFIPEGRLWNARLLPFYYLALYLLAAIGVAEVARLVATLFARDVNRPIRSVMAVTAVGGLAALVVVALPLHTLPFGQLDSATGAYKWLFWSTSNGAGSNDSSFISSWANWNFTGYEGKSAYHEYHDIVAMWEHEEQHDRYGTPMALMLLPFWTNGCIGSMEGLYFEASSTTPYHFINQDELSRNPSNAQRDLPYRAGPPTKADFDLGIEHLKLLGVRYYMAISEGPDGMIDLAHHNKDLSEVAESGPWQVFEIKGADLVEPMKYEPAVVKLNDPSKPLSQDLQAIKNADGSSKPKTGSPWQFMAMDWYQDPEAWDVYLSADGPAGWQRVDRGGKPSLKAEKPIEVTNVSSSQDTISFDVSEPGVPVLVKMSYFPNWKASGAEGPFRVTPNLMVVVPTSNHVELRYGFTGVDYLGWLLTLLGLVGVVFLFRSKPIKVPDPSDPNAAQYQAAQYQAAQYQAAQYPEAQYPEARYAAGPAQDGSGLAYFGPPLPGAPQPSWDAPLPDRPPVRPDHSFQPVPPAVPPVDTVPPAPPATTVDPAPPVGGAVAIVTGAVPAPEDRQWAPPGSTGAAGGEVRGPGQVSLDANDQDSARPEPDGGLGSELPGAGAGPDVVPDVGSRAGSGRTGSEQAASEGGSASGPPDEPPDTHRDG